MGYIEQIRPNPYIRHYMDYSQHKYGRPMSAIVVDGNEYGYKDFTNEYTDSVKCDIWHKALEETKVWQWIMKSIQYESPLWTDREARDRLIANIVTQDAYHKDYSGYETTIILPFEIWLCCNGLECVSFRRINVYSGRSRIYQNGNKTISIVYVGEPITNRWYFAAAANDGEKIYMYEIEKTNYEDIVNMKFSD